MIDAEIMACFNVQSTDFQKAMRKSNQLVQKAYSCHPALSSTEATEENCDYRIKIITIILAKSSDS
jgi:hypothetical protein